MHLNYTSLLSVHVQADEVNTSSDNTVPASTVSHPGPILKAHLLPSPQLRDHEVTCRISCGAVSDPWVGDTGYGAWAEPRAGFSLNPFSAERQGLGEAYWPCLLHGERPQVSRGGGGGAETTGPGIGEGSDLAIHHSSQGHITSSGWREVDTGAGNFPDGNQIWVLCGWGLRPPGWVINNTAVGKRKVHKGRKGRSECPVSARTWGRPPAKPITAVLCALVWPVFPFCSGNCSVVLL